MLPIFVTAQSVKLPREHVTCYIHKCQIMFQLDVVPAGPYSSHNNVITRAHLAAYNTLYGQKSLSIAVFWYNSEEF
jgi:hypothetical protein